MSNTPDNNRLDADQPTLLNIEIIVDEDVTYVANEQRLRDACTAATSLRDFHEGEIGIRVTTDAAIHVKSTANILGHDYPTDVISFPYAANPPHIEGELVVSLDTASLNAPTNSAGLLSMNYFCTSYTEPCTSPAWKTMNHKIALACVRAERAGDAATWH